MRIVRRTVKEEEGTGSAVVWRCVMRVAWRLLRSYGFRRIISRRDSSFCKIRWLLCLQTSAIVVAGAFMLLVFGLVVSACIFVGRQLQSSFRLPPGGCTAGPLMCLVDAC
jgi:hypothetical protein